MKSILSFFTLLVFFLANPTNAQVSISLNVDSHPTPRISEWIDHSNLAILTVTNSSPKLEGVKYQIKVQMYLDGDLVVETNKDVAIQTLSFGTETFLAEDIIPYSALEFRKSSFEKQIVQTGMLPAGIYDFCVSIIDLDGRPISNPEKICQPMVITAYQMPELLTPLNAEEIEAQLIPTVIFRWTPLTPMPPADEGVKYIIAVTPVEDGQSPTQAFHVNYPIIEEEVITGTQFMWPSSIDAPEEITQYVWSIKPVTLDDVPYKSGTNGFVDVQTFTIKRADDINLDSCNCTDENMSQPNLSLIQPEPNLYPKKLELDNILALRDFLYDCNDSISNISHQITIDISWDSNHTENIINNGPFQHTYSDSDEIPEQICIQYTIEPRTGYNGDQCVKDFCIEVPQSIRNLNLDNVSTGTMVVNDTIYAGHNGEFAVITTQVSENNGKYTGEGNVYIGWLRARMAVKFDSITIDSNKKLLTGKILAKIYDAPAPVYPQEWAMEIAANNPMLNQTAADIVNWVENQTGQTIDYNGLNTYTNPLKLPLGLNMPNGSQLAITEMVFRHNKSEFNMVAAQETPPSWGNPQQLVGFRAQNIQFHPSQIVTPPERIELIEDITFGNSNNKILFTLRAPNTNHPGCYIEWDENGFSLFGIELDTKFTRDWFVPIPDNGQRAMLNFVATGSDWNDLLLTGNFPEAEIVDSGGMTVSGNNITFDMSDTMNPPNMVFPQNYPSGADQTNGFRGFYMKNLSVKLPKGWETNSGGQPAVNVHDMIINDTGLTLYAEAVNVLQFKQAHVADMLASIDTVHVNISGSSFVEAGIKGRIALPVTKSDSIQNPLQYNALFQVAQNPSEQTHFQLSVEPTGPINAHLLKGKMTLDPTSNIIAYVDKNKKTFQSTLNGNFVWDDVKLGPIKHVNFDLAFQDIQLNYNSSLQNNKFQFNAGHWAFASPQKYLANFPVTIEDINYVPLNTTGNQLMHGKLNFDVIFNLSNDIGGQTKMAVEAAIEDNAGGTGVEKFKPVYIGTGIDDISVYAHLSAVSIDGTIQFRNDDPVYGNGFKGTVSAAFKTPRVAIDALAEFGNTSFQYSSTYRYWRVEVAAKFQPGLAFLPGVAFYGFGGGAYHNMLSTFVPATGNTPSKYTFSPHKGNLGFKVSATVGAAPKVESFNADVTLNGQFSSSQGLVNIGFSGDFYVGAPLMPQSKRDEAQLKGALLANYNFPDKHFYFNTTVNVNKAPTVQAYNQTLVLDINGKTNKWFFKFGEPANVNDVNIFGFNLYQYLMFGNDINAPANGFTESFRQRYYNVTNHYPGIPAAPGVNALSATGKGFALGVGFKIDKDVEKNLVANYKLYLGLDAGAEVNLSMMEYNGQNCANPSQSIGFNGWRARGSIGFYVDATADVKKGNNTWNLANLTVGGWLDAKFPRPTYVAGAVEGEVQIGHFTTKIHILGDCNVSGCGAYHVNKRNGHWGINKRTACVHLQNHYLLNTSFYKPFDWGDSCALNDNNTSPDIGPTVAQEDAAGDQEQNLIKYVHAGPSYEYPLEKPVIVKYGLPINEAFDVTEQQSSGAIVTRTFKLTNQVWLKVYDENTGTFVPLLLQTHQNTLGEYLYTKGISTQTQISATNLPVNFSNNVTTNNNMPVTQTAQASINILSATSYPAPTPSVSSEYDNLPPETPPVINHLEDNKTYKIIVKANLQEFKNNQWINALKSDNTPVTQTITRVFKTGPMQAQQTSRSNQ